MLSLTRKSFHTFSPVLCLHIVFPGTKLNIFYPCLLCYEFVIYIHEQRCWFMTTKLYSFHQHTGAPFKFKYMANSKPIICVLNIIIFPNICFVYTQCHCHNIEMNLRMENAIFYCKARHIQYSQKEEKQA